MVWLLQAHGHAHVAQLLLSYKAVASATAANGHTTAIMLACLGEEPACGLVRIDHLY